MASSFVDPENLTREQFVFLAKIAENTERYDDMLEYTKKLVHSTTPAMDLTADERNLVFVSFKNVIGSHRAAWRIVSAIEQKEMSHEDEDKDKATMRRAYKSTLESSLSQMCDSVLGLLESNLLPSATASDSKVLYLKMKGDYHRYLAEIKNGDERKEAADNTLAAYEAAQKIADADLEVTDPTRLGLVLNFSVFCHEFLNDTDKAIKMTKQAFDEAIIELGTLSEEACKDTALVMHLLRANLKLWSLDLDLDY